MRADQTIRPARLKRRGLDVTPEAMGPGAMGWARNEFRRCAAHERVCASQVPADRRQALLTAAWQLQQLVERPAARRQRRYARWSAAGLACGAAALWREPTLGSVSLTILLTLAPGLLSLSWLGARHEAAAEVTRMQHPSWRTLRAPLRAAGAWGAALSATLATLGGLSGAVAWTPLLLAAGLLIPAVRLLGEDLVSCQQRSAMRLMLAELWLTGQETAASAPEHSPTKPA